MIGILISFINNTVEYVDIETLHARW
jgi:hypothetical protein